MIGQIQYKVIKAIKDGAVSNLGIFYKVCKMIIEEAEDPNTITWATDAEIKAAKLYIDAVNIEADKHVKALYNTVNRSLNILIRTRLVVRGAQDSEQKQSAMHEPLSEDKIIRTTLRFNEAEDKKAELRELVMSRRLRNLELQKEYIARLR